MHGPISVAGFKAVAHFQRLRARHKFLHELAVHFFVHGDAAGGRAALAGGAEAAPDRAFDGEIEIGVVHHDDDVLAAHFEVALLESWRAGLAHDAAHFGGTGEADEIHVRMLEHRRARTRARRRTPRSARRAAGRLRRALASRL